VRARIAAVTNRAARPCRVGAVVRKGAAPDAGQPGRTLANPVRSAMAGDGACVAMGANSEPMNLKLPCVGLFTLLAGCASAPWEPARPQVRDSLVAHVPERDQARITAARTRVVELRDQLAAAAADEREAERLIDLSQRNRDTLETRAATARSTVEYARTHRTNADLEQARRETEDVERAVRFAADQVRYQEHVEALAEERIELLERRIALAEAQVELTKARAVSALDRPVADEIDVAAHERAVAELTREVEQARIEAQVARQRVELQKQLVDERQDGVAEALRLQTVQPVESLFEARAFERHELERMEGDAGGTNRPVEASGTRRDQELDRERGRPEPPRR
jgi:hypothetical protein